MSTRRILVLGGGFARLWSAVNVARKLDEIAKRRLLGRVVLPPTCQNVVDLKLNHVLTNRLRAVSP